MERSTLLWTLVAFFGAGIAFTGARQITEDEATIVQVLAQFVVLALIIGFIVIVVRRSERDDREP